MNNRQINNIIRNRTASDILLRIFDHDDNDSNNLDNCLNMWDSDRQRMVVDAINNADNGNGIRIWLSQDQMDRDSDTWRGINRVFGISRADVSVLRRRGVVSDSFFDDGTLHININVGNAIHLINNTMCDDALQTIIDDAQSIIDSNQSLIDRLTDTNDNHL